MKTVNRGHLLRAAKAGKLVKIASRQFDDAFGETRSTNTVPVRIREDYDDVVEGMCNLWEHDFKTKSGHAYKGENGRICLIVHSNLSFDLKRVE